MNWYLKVLKSYAEFGGRARRSEFWWFALFSSLITIGLLVIDLSFGTFNQEIGWGLLSGIYNLAVFIPSLAVTVRRLHDTGKSGFWYFIVLVPLIGGFILLAFLVTDGEPYQNQYGLNPKEDEEYELLPKT